MVEMSKTSTKMLMQEGLLFFVVIEAGALYDCGDVVIQQKVVYSVVLSPTPATK